MFALQAPLAPRVIATAALIDTLLIVLPDITAQKVVAAAFAENINIEENKVWFTLFFGFFLPNPQPLAEITKLLNVKLLII